MAVNKPIFASFASSGSNWCDYFLATCVLGSEQVPDLPPLLPWDKMVHAGMFFVLSAVCYYDYYRLFDGNVHLKKWIFWCFLFL